uniref:Uncharacterized protein n=1 Tax=Lepisosteus oculatus TaxID=7918 RepID=W5MZD1_LEPOC
EKVCSYNDVIQYLNLSKDNNLFTLTRPVKDWRDPTEVYIEVFLYAILAVIEKSQIFTAFIWTLTSWENEFISWDPSQFCGISNISIPRELMWEPDVFIFEATDEDKSQRSPYLYILNDGTVFVEDDVRAVTSCRMNVYQFPFDTQTCNLTFGAMIHQVDTVRLIPFSNSSRATELSQQVLHSQGDWEFLGMRVLNSSFGLDRGKWDQIIYEISMKRRPELYVINFLLPIFFFLLLDIFSFFISETKGEKLGFKVTIILGISVLLLILNEILPSSSRKPPLIANFCIAIFAFMLLSLLETILITYLMEKDSASPAERGLKGCEMLSSEPSRKAETEGYQEHSECAAGRRPFLCFTILWPLQGSNSSITVKKGVVTDSSDELLATAEHVSILLSSTSEDTEPGYWTKLAEKIHKVFFCCYLASVVVFLVFMFLTW